MEPQNEIGKSELVKLKCQNCLALFFLEKKDKELTNLKEIICPFCDVKGSVIVIEENGKSTDTKSQ